MKDTVGRGAVAEKVLATTLMKRNYNVYMPLTHKSKYDMIVDVDGLLYKIQVKRVYFVNNHGKRTPCIETRRLTTSRSKDKHKTSVAYYEKNDYDLLIGVDVNNNRFYTFTQEQASKYKAQIYLENKLDNHGLILKK